jgi:hypothetical protein
MARRSDHAGDLVAGLEVEEQDEEQDNRRRRWRARDDDARLILVAAADGATAPIAWRGAWLGSGCGGTGF